MGLSIRLKYIGNDLMNATVRRSNFGHFDLTSENKSSVSIRAIFDEQIHLLCDYSVSLIHKINDTYHQDSFAFCYQGVIMEIQTKCEGKSSSLKQII